MDPTQLNAQRLLEQYMQAHESRAATSAASEAAQKRPGGGLAFPSHSQPYAVSVPNLQLQNALQPHQMPSGGASHALQMPCVGAGATRGLWAPNDSLASQVETLRQQVLASVGAAGASNTLLQLQQQKQNQEILNALRNNNVASSNRAIFSGTLAMLPASEARNVPLEQLRNAGPEMDNMILLQLLQARQARVGAQQVAPTTQPPKKRRKKYTYKQAKENFPKNVYRMLEFVEESGLEEIISWCHNGTAFKVHQADAFLAQIVPKFFAQRQFDSFRRQLCNYGFERVDNDRGEYVYANRFFIKGRKDLLDNIKRMEPRRGEAKTAA